MSKIDTMRTDQQFHTYRAKRHQSLNRSVSNTMKAGAVDEMFPENSDKDRLKIEVYFDATDRFTTALATRFSSHVVSLLSATEYLVRPVVEKEALVIRLKSFYPKDLQKDIIYEYRLFCRTLEQDDTVDDAILADMQAIFLHMLEKGMFDTCLPANSHPASHFLLMRTQLFGVKVCEEFVADEHVPSTPE
ncbi:hypothetical protein BSL78_14275 [Apostichopus japonicus]|uniref:Uncharacterized protein n=1 Tax=Stichopus japonicus TaxID=307972 RepID=A0A2G8KLI8_STIJA|nr:hypothetical protein BSL78_14275 [Apostichopus japonicus]